LIEKLIDAKRQKATKHDSSQSLGDIYLLAMSEQKHTVKQDDSEYSYLANQQSNERTKAQENPL